MTAKAIFVQLLAFGLILHPSGLYAQVGAGLLAATKAKPALARAATGRIFRPGEPPQAGSRANASKRVPIPFERQRPGGQTTPSGQRIRIGSAAEYQIRATQKPVPHLATQKATQRPIDPVFVVTNQTITINGVKLEHVRITARRSTLIALLKLDGAFALSCDDLLLPSVNGLPPSVARNAKQMKMSMRDKHVEIYAPQPSEFASLLQKLPPTGGGGNGDPPPKPSREAGGEACKIGGKVCYDPDNEVASASLSCGPISVNLTTEGKFSLSLKIVG